MSETKSRSDISVSAWSPERELVEVSSSLCRLSRGFLQCRPEKWIPGFSMQWLPLLHTLQIESELIEVTPTLTVPHGNFSAYMGTVDDEAFSLLIDAESLRLVVDMVLEGGEALAREIVAEYLARRFLTSLSMAWSGPESSVVQFDGPINVDDVRGLGALKVSFKLNGRVLNLWLVLGKFLTERLDTLWRRQLISTSKSVSAAQISAQIAELAVPPTMLSEYMKTGTIVDLEVPLTDQILLLRNGEPWLSAKLKRNLTNFVLESVSDPAALPRLPEGHTRFGICFEPIELDGSSQVELCQPGAVLEIGRPLTSKVRLVVNGERVGQAELSSYQGRFAIVVE